ncbi:MAG: acyltransferase family protein, partial [Bdellovibrionota bacterium]
MPRSAPHRIFGLDILRAFAIAAVVYGHYQEILGSPFPSLPYFDGVIGVELFFVLSGFLIGGIVLSALRSGRFQGITGVQDFWHRRWYRTFPNYFLFLALAAGLQWSTVSGADLLRYVSFTQNFAWKMPVFFAVSWTLAIEEWFYILLPLLVIGLRAAGLGWKKTFGFSALLLLGASIAYALTLESAPNW